MARCIDCRHYPWRPEADPQYLPAHKCAPQLTAKRWTRESARAERHCPWFAPRVQDGEAVRVSDAQVEQVVWQLGDELNQVAAAIRQAWEEVKAERAQAAEAPPAAGDQAQNEAGQGQDAGDSQTAATKPNDQDAGAGADQAAEAKADGGKGKKAGEKGGKKGGQ